MCVISKSQLRLFLIAQILILFINTGKKNHILISKVHIDQSSTQQRVNTRAAAETIKVIEKLVRKNSKKEPRQVVSQNS